MVLLWFQSQKFGFINHFGVLDCGVYLGYFQDFSIGYPFLQHISEVDQFEIYFSNLASSSIVSGLDVGVERCWTFLSSSSSLCPSDNFYLVVGMKLYYLSLLWFSSCFGRDKGDG